MFKSLTIKNFRTHSFSEFLFSPGVNVFVGESQSGKTGAIILSILWLMNNRPIGGNIFHNNAKSGDNVKVTLELTEGHSISLEKQININKEGKKEVVSAKYTLDGKKYENPKTDVPDRITEILNLSDLNVQKQLDPFFLICSTSGEIIKTINKIIHFEKIGEWISELTKRINKTNSKASVLDSDIDEIKKNLALYKDIDKVKRSISKLDLVEKKITDKDFYVKELKEIYYFAERCKSDVKRIRKIFIPANKYLNEAIGLDDEIREQKKEHFSVLKMLNLHSDVLVLKRKVKVNGILDRAVIMHGDSLRLEKEGRSIMSLLNLDLDVSTLKRKVKVNDTLNKAVLMHKNLLGLKKEERSISHLLDLFSRKERSRQGYDEIKGKYIKMLTCIKKCPICFSPVNKKTLQNILDEFD